MTDLYRSGSLVAPRAGWEQAGSLTVEQTAVRVGHYKWIEMRIFEVMGSWVAIVPELDVKLRLGTHCHHHAFHAELWHKRLPEIHDVNPERLTRPPNAELETFVRALAEPEVPAADPGAAEASDTTETTLEKLVGFYRVLLPHLIATYSSHRDNAGELTDAPTIRWLNFCLLDDMDEWREGELLLQSLIREPADVERAAAHQIALSKFLLAAGGVVGPASTGLDLTEHPGRGT